MNGIGNIIRIYRKKRGLTQLCLAMRLGVTPQAVGKWERGESEPDLTLLCPLAKELNVTLETLFGKGQSGGFPAGDDFSAGGNSSAGGSPSAFFCADKLRENLKNRRLAAGLTQAELAAKLSVRPQTVSKWETGICAPDIGYCTQLCALYGITPTALLTEDCPPAEKDCPARSGATEKTTESLPTGAGGERNARGNGTYGNDLRESNLSGNDLRGNDLRGAERNIAASSPADALSAAESARTALPLLIRIRNYFIRKPLRLLALLLCSLLLVTATCTPLLLGGSASSPSLEGEDPTETIEPQPPSGDPDEPNDPAPPDTSGGEQGGEQDGGPSSEDGEENDPPDGGETEKDPDEGGAPPTEPEEPPAVLNYCTLTFYDGLQNTSPGDNGIFGQGEVPEGTVLVLEEQPDQLPAQTLIGYYDGEACFDFGGLGSTRFDDYISYGCFDEEGKLIGFPLTVTENTDFYMEADPLWIDYFAYDTYAEQTIAQEICTILRGACETLSSLPQIYEAVRQYAAAHPETSRSVLLGWAGVPPETIEITVGAEELPVTIPWIGGNFSTLRERLAQFAQTDPKTAERIRTLVNEQFLIPQAYFFYALANEEIPLEQGAVTALSYFAAFAQTMPAYHAAAYAAFMDGHANVPACALPAVTIGAQYLV